MTIYEAQARVAEIRARIGVGAPARSTDGQAFAAALQSATAPSSTSASASAFAATGVSPSALSSSALSSSALSSSALDGSSSVAALLAGSSVPGAAVPGTSPAALLAALGGTSAARPAGGPTAVAATAMMRPATLTGVPFADLFQRAGARHGVAPALLAAVAKVESGYNPSAVSRAGAQGLMQLMPGTARGLGVNALDPAQAVDGAARMLSANLQRFGSVELALAAYNAGGSAVSRYGGIPPFPETQAYIPKVKAAMAQLAGRGLT